MHYRNQWNILSHHPKHNRHRFQPKLNCNWQVSHIFTKITQSVFLWKYFSLFPKPRITVLWLKWTTLCNREYCTGSYRLRQHFCAFYCQLPKPISVPKWKRFSWIWITELDYASSQLEWGAIKFQLDCFHQKIPHLWFPPPPKEKLWGRMSSAGFTSHLQADQMKGK